MKQNYLPGLLFVLILAIAGLVCYNLFVIPKSPSLKPPSIQEPGTTQELTVSPLPTLNPTIKKKIDEVKEKGGKIPFDYEVTSVNTDIIELMGVNGKLRIRNLPIVKVFFKEGDILRQASFSDIKVGQKLSIERVGSPSQEIKISILR